MQINEAGLNLIKEFEGYNLAVYRDIVGYKTVGYGHRCPDLNVGDVITKNQADAYLMADLAKFEHGVSNLLDVTVTSNQFSALVSFAYNLGLGDLATSGLLKLVNAKEFDAAAEQFQRWDHAGGIEIAGLLRRRLAERDLFLS